jgi:hypothetical protein
MATSSWWWSREKCQSIETLLERVAGSRKTRRAENLASQPLLSSLPVHDNAESDRLFYPSTCIPGSWEKCPAPLRHSNRLCETARPRLALKESQLGRQPRRAKSLEQPQQPVWVKNGTRLKRDHSTVRHVPERESLPRKMCNHLGSAPA